MKRFIYLLRFGTPDLDHVEYLDKKRAIITIYNENGARNRLLVTVRKISA